MTEPMMPVTVEQGDADWDQLIKDAVAKMPPPCQHDFGSWRDFEDGSGGEQFCQKCGLGAMNWSMWNV